MLAVMRATMILALVALVVALGAATLAGPAAASTPPRYYFALEEVKVTDSAPAEVSVKAKTILRAVLASRPEFIPALDGAPDPVAAPFAYRKFLAAKKVAAYQVNVKITDYARAVEPNDKPGKSGQILTIRIGVSLLGAKIPGGVLALAGSGGATVMAEVGSKIRPREEEGAMDEALKNALEQAVDAAVYEMRRPPPKVIVKKKRK